MASDATPKDAATTKADIIRKRTATLKARNLPQLNLYESSGIAAFIKLINATSIKLQVTRMLDSCTVDGSDASTKVRGNFALFDVLVKLVVRCGYKF